MKNVIIAMTAAAAVTMSSCTTKSAKTDEQSEKEADKVLVLYYSQTGTTKTVAEEIGNQLGADIAAIEAVDPYPNDYDATIERWRKELTDSILPEIKPLDVNLDDYSTIFLGYPVWGGTYALPIATFVKNNDLKGKRVITFATFGSGGIGSSTADLIKALPDAKVEQGYGVRTARLGKAKDEITRYLVEAGFKEGNVEKLPDYSSQAPVTDEETKIFHEACDGYKFPLGTPITVGKRDTNTGTDYKFTAKANMPGGEESEITIYVTVTKGEKTEFTLVER
jgi:flavodoxin